MDWEPLFFNLRTLILEGFMSELTDFEQEVAEMLVESLNLPIKPEAKSVLFLSKSIERIYS
jgi:sulfur relay (sulfurtransferase) DsrC/TusE family protein